MDALTLAVTIVAATAGNAARAEVAPALRSVAANCFQLMNWAPERIAVQARDRVPPRVIRVLPRRPATPRPTPCFRLTAG